MPISIASAPRGRDGPHDVEPAGAEPAGHVGDEELAPGVAPGPQVARTRSLTPSASPVSRSATCAASLSPRPDRVTSTVEPAGTDAPGLASQPADRVRRLERRQDPLGRGEQLEAGERLVVGRRAGTRPGPIAASAACSGPTPG